LYISSIYFIITSFTSIGYGDIRGYTKWEQEFLLLMLIVGIGFYGYMIGTIQQLLASMVTTDMLAEE
jgi:hypothetical protein